MSTDPVESAYCVLRIERSTALANASEDDCARLAHLAMADLYEQRLSGLNRPAAEVHLKLAGAVQVLPRV